MSPCVYTTHQIDRSCFPFCFFPKSYLVASKIPIIFNWTYQQFAILLCFQKCINIIIIKFYSFSYIGKKKIVYFSFYPVYKNILFKHHIKKAQQNPQCPSGHTSIFRSCTIICVNFAVSSRNGTEEKTQINGGIW